MFVSATILVNKVEYIISGRLDFGTNVFKLSGFSYDWRGYSRCCILCCFVCCLTVLNYEISVPCVTRLYVGFFWSQGADDMWDSDGGAWGGVAGFRITRVGQQMQLWCGTNRPQLGGDHANISVNKRLHGSLNECNTASWVEARQCQTVYTVVRNLLTATLSQDIRQESLVRSWNPLFTARYVKFN